MGEELKGIAAKLSGDKPLRSTSCQVHQHLECKYVRLFREQVEVELDAGYACLLETKHHNP